MALSGTPTRFTFRSDKVIEETSRFLIALTDREDAAAVLDSVTASTGREGRQCVGSRVVGLDGSLTSTHGTPAEGA